LMTPWSYSDPEARVRLRSERWLSSAVEEFCGCILVITIAAISNE
jgi:hypothetical protein